VTSPERVEVLCLLIWAEICSGYYDIRIHVSDVAERDLLISVLAEGRLGDAVAIPDFGVHILNRYQVHVLGSPLIKLRQDLQMVRDSPGGSGVLRLIEGRMLR
jgi:hypothetical protein